ncbi:MAG: enoyl-CoA hydratase/isomerase family protein [Dehalococcoidia bacterium]
MEYKDIAFETEDGVATITLNRPQKLNAMTWRSWAEVEEAIERAEADDAVRVLVVTGAGRGFCSGTDLTPEGADEPEASNRRQRLRSRFLPTVRLVACQKPTIAAVNGVAAGAGLSFCLGCDIRIASQDARFIAVWSRRALVPDFGCSYLLPRLVGMERALTMMYSSDPVAADEALKIGLVSQVVLPEELMPTAMALARKIAQGPPIALEFTKRLAYRSWLHDLEEQVQYEEYLQRACHDSEDFQEGVRSFLEKRPPHFQGR